MDSFAPGSTRREAGTLRRWLSLLTLALVALALALSSGCGEEELAPIITELRISPNCDVMKLQTRVRIDPDTGEPVTGTDGEVIIDTLGVFLEVQYFARASGGNRFDDPNGTNSGLEFEWDFGDGQTAKNRVAGFHRYYEPGDYTIELRVKDKDGDEAEHSGNLFVGDLNSDIDVLEIGLNSSNSTPSVVNQGQMRLIRYDVTNPASPDTVSVLQLPDTGTVQDIAVGPNNYVYIAAGDRGVYVYDVSAPDPMLVNQIAFTVPGGTDPDLAMGLDIQGNTMTVALTFGLLQRLDISDPLNPVFNPNDGLIVGLDPEPGTPQDLKMSGEYTLVPDIVGLSVYNLNDLPDSVLTGRGADPAVTYTVDVNGDVALVSESTTGVGVFDISNPREPLRVGWFPTDVEVLNAVFADGSTAVIVDGGGGVYTVDVSGGGNPLPLGYVNTPGVAADVVVSGDYAYVANSGGIVIIDIGNPSAPSIVAMDTRRGNGRRIALDGTDAYVVAQGRLTGWFGQFEGTLTTPCPASGLVQEFDWTWNFGDGSDPFTHDSDPSHLYPRMDSVVEYWVRLQVTERQTSITRTDSILVEIPEF